MHTPCKKIYSRILTPKTRLKWEKRKDPKKEEDIRLNFGRNWNVFGGNWKDPKKKEDILLMYWLIRSIDHTFLSWCSITTTVYLAMGRYHGRRDDSNTSCKRCGRRFDTFKGLSLNRPWWWLVYIENFTRRVRRVALPIETAGVAMLVTAMRMTNGM